MATHSSTHRLHSGSLPACTTRAQLHGIPRQEGREADLAMAVADFVKSAGESFRVGWKIESNWTDPVLFATYQVIRPLASLLIVALDRKSTRLNSSHTVISYAVFCLKKKKTQI